MSKLVYSVLAAAYPRRPREGIPQSGIDQAQLYESIGHKEFASDPRMQNTCATRVSMALLAAGIHPAPGNLTIQAGRFAGLRIETNQQALSNFLRRRLGQPEVYKNGYDAWSRIKPRHGIVSFFHLHGGDWDPQGHIDLICHDDHHRLACEGGHVYWQAVVCWFWACP